MQVRLQPSISMPLIPKAIRPNILLCRTFNRTLRPLTTPSSLHSITQTPPPSQPSPSHWLTTTKSRLGKLILFGLSRPQCQRLSSILQILTTEWRTLIAGREGFLTSPNRAGLLKHKVVWGEMDVMGHVNNVTYVRYAESARINWARNLEMESVGEAKALWRDVWTPRGEGMILRSIRTDYKFPMTFPDSISVFHKLRASPLSSKDPTSFILDVLIFSELHQRPAARCEEDIVVYDYRAGKKAPMRDFMRDGFQKIWEEQEVERKRAVERINEVEGLIRGLEKETWDREDAVEDMGGAGG